MSINILIAPNPSFTLYERSYAFGPLVEGDQVDGTWFDLFGREWRLTRESEITIETFVDGQWVPASTITEIPELGRRADRKLTFAFDTASRIVFAWENTRDNPGVFLHRYSVSLGDFEVLGPFAGVDSAVFNDAEVSYHVGDNRVVLVYLSEDRKTLLARYQSGNFVDEHVLTTFDEPRYLVGIERLPYQYGVQLAFEPPDPKVFPPVVDEVWYSDFYPIRVSTEMSGDVDAKVMRYISALRHYGNEAVDAVEMVGDAGPTWVKYITGMRHYDASEEVVTGDARLLRMAYTDAMREVVDADSARISALFGDMVYNVVSQNHFDGDSIRASAWFEELQYISISQTISPEAEVLSGDADVYAVKSSHYMTPVTVESALVVGEGSLSKVAYRDTVLVPPSLAPDEVEGMVLWLDSGTIVVPDSTPLSVWPDLSGHAYDAVAPTLGQTPTFFAADQPRVYYDGNDFSQSELVMPVDFTLLSCFSTSQPASGYAHILFATRDDVSPTEDFVVAVRGDGRVLVVADESAYLSDAAVVGFEDFHYLSVDRDLVLRVDNNNVPLSPHELTEQLITLDGDVMEVVLYSRRVGSDERRRVEAYFLAKYPKGIYAVHGLRGWYDFANIPEAQHEELYLWSDKSGLGNTATQESGEHRPFVQAGVGVVFEEGTFLNMPMNIAGSIVYYVVGNVVQVGLGDVLGIFSGVTSEVVVQEFLVFADELSPDDDALVMNYLEGKYEI